MRIWCGVEQNSGMGIRGSEYYPAEMLIRQKQDDVHFDRTRFWQDPSILRFIPFSAHLFIVRQT